MLLRKEGKKQRDYGVAIRQDTHSVAAMKTAVWSKVNPNKDFAQKGLTPGASRGLKKYMSIPIVFQQLL